MDFNRHFKGIYVIWLRELKRYWRDRVRMLVSLVQPILFLTILGTGISANFRAVAKTTGAAAPMSKISFFYPGIIAMTLLFTSIFSAVSIVWDREFGFLKEVLVAPISRSSVAVGKALGGATVAMFQGTIMLLFLPFMKLEHFNILLLPVLWLTMLFVAFSLTSLGIIVAARMRSMEGFQMIMNFLMMPMFLLSGALFNLSSLPKALALAIMLNPFAYGVDLIRGLMGGVHYFHIFTDVLVLSIFMVASISIAVRMFKVTE